MSSSRVLLGFVAAVLLASLPVAAAGKKGDGGKSSAQRTAQAAEHRAKGQAAVEAGKDDEAAAEFSQAVALDANDEISQHELGKILFKQGKLPEAIARFQAAVKLDPKDSLAWYNLAYASRKAQQFAQAADAYQKYTALQPDDPDGYFGRAESLRQANRPREAIDAYQTYLKKETRASEAKWVERSKERIVELQKAASEQDAAGQAAAEKAAADKLAAEKAAQEKAAQEKAAQEKAAQEKAAQEKAAQEKKASGFGLPASAGAGSAGVAGGAGSSSAGGKSAEGEHGATEAQAGGNRKPEAGSPSSPGPSSPPPRVIVHGADEKPPGERIVVSSKGVTAPAPPDPAPSAAVARAKIADGDRAFAARDFRTALFAYQDAVQAQPANVDALVKAGQAYARLGYDNEAIDQWNRALALDPQNAAAHELIAAAHERRAEMARRIKEPSAPPRTAAADVKPAAPVDEEGARKHYAAGVGLVREAAALADAPARAKKYEEAVAELDLAVAARPGYAVALIARGSARVGLGTLDEAIADYAAAHVADPALAAPLFGLAEAYRGLGQAEKAADMYRQFAGSTAPDAQANLKAYALKNAQALAPR